MAAGVQFLASPWTVTCQAPLSMGFSRQERWSGLLFPSSGDIPDPGMELMSLMSPALAGRFFTTSRTWEARGVPYCIQYFMKAGREGDDREGEGWMASPTQWTWFWVDSGSWWWTWRPGLLRLMGLQWVRHNWVTELNRTEVYIRNGSNLDVHEQING